MQLVGRNHVLLAEDVYVLDRSWRGMKHGCDKCGNVIAVPAATNAPGGVIVRLPLGNHTASSAASPITVSAIKMANPWKIWRNDA